MSAAIELESHAADYFPIILGFALIVIAIFLRERLGRREVINVKLEKLQVALVANAFGSVVLAGFALALGGMYVVYENFEEKIRLAQVALSEAQSSLEEYKRIRLTLNLLFPKDSQPGEDAVATAEYRRGGEPHLHSYPPESVRFSWQFSGWVAEFNDLHYGDMLRVNVKTHDGTKSWRSAEVPVPAAYLEMNPEQ